MGCVVGFALGTAVVSTVIVADEFFQISMVSSDRKNLGFCVPSHGAVLVVMARLVL